jgi:hypothetical protein
MIPRLINGSAGLQPEAPRPAGGEAAAENAGQGQSFADLLSAMLAPEPPVPPAEAAVFDKLDGAEVFNETGLFRGAAPLAAMAFRRDSAALPEGGKRSPAQEYVPAPGSVLAPPSVLLSALPPETVTGAAASAGLASLAKPGRPEAQPMRKVASVPGPGLSPPSAVARKAEPGSSRQGLRPAAARLVQEHLARGGSAAAQVSVQAVEAGLSLAVRADRLSREQRERLRVEIGDLLARHGFTAAEIMLNGEAEPRPQGRKD